MHRPILETDMDTFYETSQARGLKFLYQLSDVRSRSLNRDNHSSEITDLEPRRARHTQRPAPSAQQGKKLKGWVRRTMRPPSPQVGPGPGQYVTTHRIFMKLPGGTRPGVRRPRPACARH